MNIKPVAPGFAVSPQIHPSDIPAIKARGFGAIICNRPDHEDHGQPSFAEIAAAASAAGLDVRHIPFAPNAQTPGDVAAFARAIDELPGPVLGYCRSGGRAASIWSQSGR